MKRLILLITVWVIAAIPASAQNQSTSGDIPFQFVVNNTVLPAGTYLLRIESMDNVMFIQNADTRQTVAAVIVRYDLSPGVNSEKPVLLFARNREGRFQLHQVSFGGGRMHTHNVAHPSGIPEPDGN